MPIFDFVCKECKLRKEVRVKDSDDPVECPECKQPMIKQISMPTFILKGKDWSSNGSFAKAKEGPYIDKSIFELDDRQLNIECGLPPDLE